MQIRKYWLVTANDSSFHPPPPHLFVPRNIKELVRCCKPECPLWLWDFKGWNSNQGTLLLYIHQEGVLLFNYITSQINAKNASEMKDDTGSIVVQFHPDK